MIYFLSILIPAYNHPCLDLVTVLSKQATMISNLNYEIIVVEDGSDNSASLNINKAIGDIPHCKYIIRKENSGRAAIRNFLANEAVGQWLLFLDCDIVIDNTSFLLNYIELSKDNMTVTSNTAVIYGGVTTADITIIGNLRWKYEKEEEQNHTVDKRKCNPYKSFRTTNFLVKKSTMLALPFDESITTYGYEDVMFGKRLEGHSQKILHINNPVTLGYPEDNITYLKKIREALSTLLMLRVELQDYSPLISITNKIKRFHLSPCLILWHKLFAGKEIHNLKSNNPSLFVLKLYKLGYFISIQK